MEHKYQEHSTMGHRYQEKLHQKMADAPDQHDKQKGWPQAAEVIFSQGKDSKHIPQVNCFKIKKKCKTDKR